MRKCPLVNDLPKDCGGRVWEELSAGPPLLLVEVGLDPILEGRNAAVNAVDILVPAFHIGVGWALAPTYDSELDRLAADGRDKRPAAVAIAGIALAGFEAGAKHRVG